MKRPEKKPNGYIALIALLIVAAAGLAVGISVSLSGITELQMAYSRNQALEAKTAANACIEEGLRRLAGSWANYAGSLSIGTNSCIINAVVSGGNAVLNATGTVDVIKQKINVSVDSNLEVVSWEEE